MAPLYHHAKTPTTQGPSRRLAAVGHHFMGRASIRPEEAQRVEGGEDVLGGSTTVELEDAMAMDDLLHTTCVYIHIYICKSVNL